jgi:hypothetical protein
MCHSDRRTHNFLYHEEKQQALLCPACDYGDVVHDRFLRHIATYHREVPQRCTWFQARLEAPFRIVWECDENACDFCAVRERDFTQHRLEVHGLTVERTLRGLPPLPRPFVPAPMMPLGFAAMARRTGLPWLGRNQGLEHLYIAVKEFPQSGLHFIMRGPHRIGSAAINVFPADPEEPFVPLLLPWPRFKADIVDTQENRFVATFETQAALQEGIYSCHHLHLPEDAFVFRVYEPMYY